MNVELYALVGFGLFSIIVLVPPLFRKPPPKPKEKGLEFRLK